MTHTTHSHRTNWVQAQATIKAHGHWADITLEGLLAKSDGVDRTHRGERSGSYGSWVAMGNALRRSGADYCLTDDAIFEDFKLFPIDDDGKVDSRLVRQWLGY